MQLVGLDSAWNGSPTLADGFQVQAGFQVVNFTAGSPLGTLVLPKGFPNGLLSFVGNVHEPNAIVSLQAVVNVTTPKQDVDLYLFINGSAATGNHAITYIAIGW